MDNGQTKCYEWIMGRLNITYMFVKIRPAAFQNESIGEEKKNNQIKI